MKRFFSVFLCLTVWLSASAYDFQVDGIYYNIIGNGQVEVTYLDISNPCYSGSIVIPSSVTYNNSTSYDVTSIGNEAFFECSGLTSVTIPRSVTSIGVQAFAYCSSLTSITIPNSVTSIEENAFFECIGLTSATIIGNGLTSIHQYSFGICISLTSVTIGDGVADIGYAAFMGCSNLTSITIGKNLTSIDSGAFNGSQDLNVIYCHATTPPSIHTSDVFDNYGATLYVPESSVDLYQSAAYWKKFYIQPLPDGPTQLEYNLADRNVIYCNDIVYNEDGLNIKLFDVSGRLISSGNGDIEMSSYPNGIYIVTDGKGGFLKINHYR